MRIGVLATLALVLSACGSDVPVTSASTTASSIPAPTSTTSSQPTTDRAVVFAYVTAFDGTRLTVDYAEMLTGDEATAAAREDGEIGADETMPNDFYIRNQDPLLRTLEVMPGAAVTLQVCFVDGPCVSEEAVTLSQWAELLAGDTPEDLPTGWQWYGGGFLPYWLTLENGVVVEISEQYLP